MGPLDGIRVLDLTRLLPGPFATMVLRDLGAQVDKIEDGEAGDYLRHLPGQRAGASVLFHALNRGKRSAIIDLKSAGGREAFERLLPGYDVLFEQFRPGVLARLGLGHDDLLRAHPKLIVCALTGYGQTSPRASRAGHDLNYLARSGVLGFQGPAGAAPQVPGFQLADVSGGLWCVVGILAALREREATGRGKLVDVAMTDGVLGFAPLSLCAALNGATVERGAEVLSGGIAPYHTYLSQDGWPVTVAALEPKFWLTFCGAVGLESDMGDLVPGPHQAERIERVAGVFRSRTREQWEAFAAEHDCCIEVVLGPDEIAADEHLSARKMLFDVPTAEGPVRCFRTPVSRPEEAFAPGPRAGEHTRAILEDAGFSADEIDELLATKAVQGAG